MSTPRARTAVTAPSADPAYEAFLAEILRREPQVSSLDGNRIGVHVYVPGESYWRISGTDLHGLLEARKFVLARAEADRG